MRSINLTDDLTRDSHVAFEPVTRERDAFFGFENGKKATSVKVIKTTFNSDFQSLLALADRGGAEIEDLLIDGDPEIDFDYTGKISSRTKTVYVDDQERIAYSLKFKEVRYDPAGAETRREDLRPEPANISDLPLTWTGHLTPIDKAIRKYVFTKIYQLRHVNGLTYDFLYRLASQLEEKKAMALIGAGKNGRKPLRFSRGGPGYRGFLHGVTRGDAYRLTLHLTNLELKDIPHEV